MKEKEEEHFGFKWRLSASWDLFYNVYLECLNPGNTEEWSLQATITAENFERVVIFTHTYTKIQVKRFDHLPGDRFFPVEFTVKIDKITGTIEPKKENTFNESNKKYSDVVLKVKDEKFYVLKRFLAYNSAYFESLFFEKVDESKQSEVELEDVEPEDFQNFLELIHGKSLVNDNTVEGILRMADRFYSETAFERSEEFLLNRSEESLKYKFNMAVTYELEELTEECFDQMKTKNNVFSCSYNENGRQWTDRAILRELFDKLATFS